MAYRGLERERVVQLPSTNLRQYLQSTGWDRFRELPERVAGEIAVFRRTVAGEEQEVVVPIRYDEEKYYFRRMAEAVSDLANYEARDAREVLDDLSTGTDDVVQFHVDDPSVADGTILIEDGLNLFEGAKRAVLASACAVVEPLPYYPRLRRATASEFIKACRMSSDRGSFIARVICPLDAVDSEGETAQLTIDEVGDLAQSVPFTRQVTLSLMRALDALVSSTDRDTTEELFEMPTKHRISANLCDALLEMQPSGRTSTLTIGTHWAISARSKSPAPSAVALKSEHFAVVEQLANRLRPQREPENSSFVGSVDELSGSPGADGRAEGRVTLRLQDGDDLITAHVELDTRDYNTAAQAHLNNRPIEIWGTLRRRARIHKFVRYERIEVLDSASQRSSEA